MEHHLTLVVLEGIFAVCRLQPGSAVPAVVFAGELSAVIRTPEETTVVCRVDNIPPGAVAEKDWRALKVKGPLDFSMTGVLASLALPLSRQGVSIFTLSTYDTDYLLVKEGTVSAAVEALRVAGHQVQYAAP